MTQTPTTGSVPPAPVPPPAKKRNWAKLIVRVLIGLAIALVLIVLLLPTIISSSLVIGYVLGSVNSGIPGKVSIKDVSLAWFSGQSVTGLTVTGADGKVIVSIDKIEAPDARLYSFAKLGAIKISKPAIHFESYADGTNNFTKAFAKPGAPSVTVTVTASKTGPAPIPVPKLPGLTVEVADGEVTAALAGQPEISITGLSASADLTDIKAAALDFKAAFTRADMTGTADGKVKVLDLIDASNNLVLPIPNYKASGDINVHVDASKSTDDIGKKLVTVAGPTIDSTLHLDGQTIGILVKSDRLNVTGGLGVSPAKVCVAQPIKVVLTTTPDTFATLTSKEGTPPAAALLSPFDTTLVLTRLDVPCEAGAFNVKKTALDAGVVVGTIGLDAHGNVGKVNWKDTNVVVHSEAVGDLITITAAGNSDQGGKLDANVQVTDAPLDGNLDRMKLIATAELLDLPIVFIDGVGGFHGKLLKTLGDKIDKGTLKATLTDKVKNGVFDLSTKSTNLNASITGAIKDGVITVNDSSNASFTLTPDAAAAWNSDPSAPVLASPITFKTTFSDVSLNLNLDFSKDIAPINRLDITKSTALILVGSYGGTVKLPNSGRVITLGSNSVSIDARKFNTDLKISFDSAFKIAASGKYPDADAKAGLTVDIHDLSLANGSANVLTTNIDLGLTATGLPMDAMMDLKPIVPLPGQSMDDAKAAAEFQKSNMVGVVGPALDATFKGTVNLGIVDPNKVDMNKLAMTFDLHASGANAKLDVPGQIGNGLFSFRDTASASLKVTPELTAMYLAKIEPILRDVQSGKDPIVLTIQKGRVAPIAYKDFNTVTMDGTLALGTLNMNRSQTVSGLVTGLNAIGAHLPDSDPYSAKFTVTRFNIKDGQILHNDLWMDTGFLLMGVQSRVYQNPADTKTFNAEMVTAITGETLGQIPGAKIDPAKLFELAASGPATSVKPDFAKFITDTAAPLAVSRLGSGRAGQIAGLVGEIGGKVMNSASASSGAATQPVAFPWFTHDWGNRPKVTWAKIASSTPDPAATKQPDQAAKPPEKKPSTSDLVDTGLGLLNGLGKKK